MKSFKKTIGYKVSIVKKIDVKSWRELHMVLSECNHLFVDNLQLKFVQLYESIRQSVSVSP